MGDGSSVARRSTRTFEDDGPSNNNNGVVGSEPATIFRKTSIEREMKLMDKFSEKIAHSRNLSKENFPIMEDAERKADKKSGSEGSDSTKEGSETLDDNKQVADKISGLPINFGTVMPGVYRSGYPQADDHEFLGTLGLKTIVTLVEKEYPEGYQAFMQSNGIKHIVIEMQGTKKVDIPQAVMNSIMEVVLDRQNHPILLHCNQGKHRTGCAVAVIRKVMGWHVDAIIEEYTVYAEPKTRETDIRYIHTFEVENLGKFSGKPPHQITPRGTDCTFSQRFSRMAKITIMTILVMGLWSLTLIDLRR